MNKFLPIICIILSLPAFAQNKVLLEKPTVDKRVELLSIVFRLAEREEYSSKHFKLYTDRIEHYFEQHKNHELIRYTKSIMDERWLGYDAVAWMAIYLDEHLDLQTDVRPLTEADGRWDEESIERFVLLLQRFYNDVDFDRFFNDNAELYAEVVKRFAPVYEQMDLNWYRTFYGKEPSETFKIVIGLGNGTNNYGPSLDYNNGEKTVYAIIGVSEARYTEGIPVFGMNNFPILIHEFNHSFVNYLIAKNREAFRESGEKIFSIVGDDMRRQAYSSWEFMMNEALVRASVIKYFKDHDFEQSVIAREVMQQKHLLGFVWIEELVDELENYDKQRDRYLTLEDYMPKLIEFYKIWAGKIERRPEVVSISEFTNGSLSVSSELKTITINFNMPLSGKGYSIYPFRKGMDAFPKIDGMKYANNNQSVIMEVSLERDKEYEFLIIGEHFTSVEGVGIKAFDVNFKTEK